MAAGSLLLSNLRGNLGGQQFIELLFYIWQLPHILQHLFDQCAYHRPAGSRFQKLARHFDADALHRGSHQYIPDVLGGVISVRHIQLEMFLQRGTDQLINILCRQLLAVTILFSHFESSIVRD